mmetsp:Transcript_8400/g.24215  ORF Transcript_8400/g.24215 Transcript_8400/m.24215 type:complete len:207 (+) Transcript_8400:94-714(+)
MYAFEAHQSISTIINQTSSFLMGFCMCDMDAFVAERKYSYRQQKQHRTEDSRTANRSASASKGSGHGGREQPEGARFGNVHVAGHSRRRCDDDPLVVKKSILRGGDQTATDAQQDDDTASTTSMNPLSFDDLDDELAFYNRAIAIDELQLDLVNGNHRDVFRSRTTPDASSQSEHRPTLPRQHIPDDRYRYFLPHSLSSSRVARPE